jgi:anti-sigma-K factor RskA
MNTDHPTELLDAYVLGVLDADEAAEVAAHLDRCADCRRELAVSAEVVAELPAALAAASPLAPPADLRDRVLRSVPAVAGSPVRDDAGPARRSISRAHGWLMLAAALRQPATAVLAVVLIMLVGSILWNARLSRALAEERSIRADLAERVGHQEVVLEVIDSPRTVKAQLRPPDSGSTAYGKLYTRPDLSHVVLMAARLPPPPEGQQYHVWLTSGEATHHSGVLDVNEEGFGLLVFDSGRPGPVYEAAQLTLQPADATAPAGAPVLVWRAAT